MTKIKKLDDFFFRNHYDSIFQFNDDKSALARHARLIIWHQGF